MLIRRHIILSICNQIQCIKFLLNQVVHQEHGQALRFLQKYYPVESLHKIKVEVYPNPATSILYFTEALSDLKIFEAGGRAVKVFDQNNLSVNVSKLSNGVYTLIGYNEKLEKITKTFIKK